MSETTPAPLGAEEVAEIAERAAKATPGPWVMQRIGETHYVHKSGAGFNVGQERADAIFIAAARTDIPRLLATLAARTSLLDKAAREVYDYELRCEALERENAAYREIVAAVAGGRRYVVATAQTPSGMIVGSSSLVCVDDETVARARALLAPSTPPATDASEQPAE